MKPPFWRGRARTAARLIVNSYLGACVAAARIALAADPAPPMAEPVEYTPGSDWPMYNKTLDGQRYSPLTQINLANAAQLAEVCHVPIADQGAFQAGLIVVGDTMYATTATDTIALDATRCAVRWRHVYHRGQPTFLAVNRGVAYANGRLFRGTDDGRLIALDAQTGAEVWADTIGDARLGEMLTGAPVAWNGLVIVGTAASEFGIRGRVIAFDALTGREVWTFNTIPVGKEVGADTWAKTNWNEHGGGGSWSTFALDPTTHEVFIPVGNPVPDFSPADRPGQNLFSNCVLVLDARTGRLKWWYQTKTNDAQDHDLGAAPLLYRDRQQRMRVAAAGKDGYLHLIDRLTHKLIAKTAVTTVDPVRRQPSSTEWVRMCPGPIGGVEWNGPAFDPQHQLLFVGAVDFCALYRTSPRSTYEAGGVNLGGTWSPGTEPATGWITAVDASSGAVKWRYHAQSPVLSGITPTAGGVVFGGDNAGNLLVFNSLTGEVLKKISTGGALAGGLITYQVERTQYVAFTSGNLSRSVWGAAGRPAIFITAVPQRSPSTAPSQEPDITRGRSVFYQTCAACHGVDGKNISIRGNDLTTVGQRMTEEQIRAWIRNPQPPMPKVFPEPLQDSEQQELRDVAAFLYHWPQ